jgi:hypothetical protein
MDILHKLKKGLQDELEYVLPNYLDNAEIMLDEPERLNFIMAYEAHILNQKFKSIDERRKLYSSIKKEELVEAMQEIFTEDNLVLNINTKKKKTVDKEKVIDIVKAHL